MRHALLTPGLDPRTRYQRFIAWVGQILRFPLAWIEKIKYGDAIRRETLSKPPIFLIGHWRSGTTHLHNLMSRDPQFGFLKFSETAMPMDMLGPKVRIARRIIDRALPKTRGYDNVKLALDEPQEEEMALGNLNPIGYYSIYYLPQDMEGHRDRALFFEGVGAAARRCFQRNYEFLIRKVSYVKGGRQLLFKNPPSTTRMEMILEMFPDAKFIHIVRNPWPVFSSSCGKFPRLFNAFAWQPFQDVDIPGFTLETYERVMRRYLADREKLQLPADQLAETSYEEITEDPLGEIGRIYDQLGLDGKEAGLREIAKYVGTLKGYRRNVHRVSTEHAEAIRERWRFSFEAWGYPLDPPEDIEVAG
ncbi:MAG: sulfotransferase [Verrucomicrobiaceae bacterium]|nr:sulfotransferase [Verrucomicrobiaceae bacterium]